MPFSHGNLPVPDQSNGSASGARSALCSQFLVGASRRRAAPRCQLVGAARVPSKRPKFQHGPPFASDAFGARGNESLQSAAIQTTLFQSCSVPKQCGLTGRSTGHFAAGRVWASFHSRPNPAHRKMPVSFNVRPHQYNICAFRRTVKLKSSFPSKLNLLPWACSPQKIMQ